MLLIKHIECNYPSAGFNVITPYLITHLTYNRQSRYYRKLRLSKYITIIKKCSNSWTIYRDIPHSAVVLLSKTSARARGTQAKLSQLYGSEGSPAVFWLHRLAEKSSKVKN